MRRWEDRHRRSSRSRSSSPRLSLRTHRLCTLAHMRRAGGFVVQPPVPMQAVDTGAAALAVVAVSIDPAPSAAAPTPARFSKRPLDTRSSVAAMSLKPPDGSGHVLDHWRWRPSIPQTREIHRFAYVASLVRGSLFGAIVRAHTSSSIWTPQHEGPPKRPSSRSPEFRGSGYLPEAFLPLSVCGLTSLVQTVPGVRVPQEVRTASCSQRASQAERTQAQPGGHCFELTHSYFEPVEQ